VWVGGGMGRGALVDLGAGLQGCRQDGLVGDAAAAEKGARRTGAPGWQRQFAP
jgi:hypothetical protein